MGLLGKILADHFSRDIVRGWLNLPPSAARIRAQLFRLGAVLQEQVDELGSWRLEIQLPRRNLEEISRREGVAIDTLPT